jgi:alpha-tubulin suppressor-like RCC1 family protein
VKVDFPSLQVGEELISIKSGDAHTIALTNLGKLYSWGNGSSGALGTGNTNSRNNPATISFTNLITNERIVAIEVGGTHSLALTSNGRVFGWGSNTRGQLGLGTATNLQTVSSPTPVTFSSLSGSETIQSIHAGYEHNFAITTLGRVFAWGFNGSNALGTTTIASNNSSFVPLLLSFSLNQCETDTKIYPGMSHNFAITSSQRILTWGLNSSGQLGTGNTTNRTTPTLLDISSSLNVGETMVDFALGTSHSIGLTSSGRMFSWGGNANGQLGNGTSTPSSTPVLLSITLSSNERILMIGASNNHSLMMTSTGRIFEWGSNINLRPTAITITIA